MSKLNDKIAEIDSKVNPDTGNLLRIIFKTITLILVIVVMPIIVALVGSFAVVGDIPNWTGYAAFFPWFVLVVISGILWFYFSKWIPEQSE